MKRILSKLRDLALRVIRTEPVRVASVLVATLVSVGVIDITQEPGAVATIAEVLGVLASGEGLRAAVFSPASVELLRKLASR